MVHNQPQNLFAADIPPQLRAVGAIQTDQIKDVNIAQKGKINCPETSRADGNTAAVVKHQSGTERRRIRNRISTDLKFYDFVPGMRTQKAHIGNAVEAYKNLFQFCQYTRTDTSTNPLRWRSMAFRCFRPLNPLMPLMSSSERYSTSRDERP